MHVAVGDFMLLGMMGMEAAPDLRAHHSPPALHARTGPHVRTHEAAHRIRVRHGHAPPWPESGRKMIKRKKSARANVHTHTCSRSLELLDHQPMLPFSMAALRELRILRMTDRGKREMEQRARDAVGDNAEGAPFRADRASAQPRRPR